MKKINVFIILLGLAFIVGRSFSGGSYLQLSLYDDSDFLVTLDDLAYTDAGNIIEFEDLQPGEHNLIIIKSPVNDQIKADVIFQGKIKIPADLNLYAVIDEYNAFAIYKKVPIDKGRCKSDCSYFRYIGKKNNPDIHEHHENDNSIAECRNVVMSDKDFKEFKKSIGNMNFENSNVTITEGMLDQNTVSTKQLAELLTYFTFESNKLDIAKYAYTHTCDKKNYYLLYNSFNFDSSVEELKNYISGK
jgi:hypothetical protein